VTRRSSHRNHKISLMQVDKADPNAICITDCANRTSLARPLSRAEISSVI
jgi:hypothetical protein